MNKKSENEQVAKEHPASFDPLPTKQQLSKNGVSEKLASEEQSQNSPNLSLSPPSVRVQFLSVLPTTGKVESNQESFEGFMNRSELCSKFC
jgi:hypothetical protein